MKSKTAKHLKPTAVHLKDLKPRKNPKAGALNAYISKVTGEKQGGGS